LTGRAEGLRRTLSHSAWNRRPGSALAARYSVCCRGTHLVQRRTSAAGGTSQIGTHQAPPSTSTRIDEVVALPSPPVVLSGRLNQHYGHLRRPSGRLPLPGSSPVIGRRAPTVMRSPLGQRGLLQFPPSLSERSAPPGSPSRLRLQALHRFHGLRPSPPGSALPRPTRHRTGGVTTRQASLHATDRSVARHFRRLTLGFDPARFQTDPPACYRAPGGYPDRTSTGKRRRTYETSRQPLT
jgi:hypothetical protein